MQSEAELAPTFERQRELRAYELLTRWLDRRYLDPILGALLPGAGDLLGAALGLMGIVVAFRVGVHPLVIARMFLNLTLDALLGALPLVGDVADVLYRANQRNLELLSQRKPREATARDWWVVLAAALGFIAALGLSIALGVALWRWLISPLFS